MLTWLLRALRALLGRAGRQEKSATDEPPSSVDSQPTPHSEEDDTAGGSSTSATASEDETKESATPRSTRCDALVPATDVEPGADTSEEQLAAEPREGKEDEECAAPAEVPEERDKEAGASLRDGEKKERREPPSRSPQPSVPDKPPKKIGPRRTTRTPSPPSPPKGAGEDRVDARRTASGPRPELTCRKQLGSPHWEVALVADDQSQVETVTWNGRDLPCIGGEWQLPSLAGKLSVRLEDGCSIEIPLAGEEALIFKLKKDWSGVGRNTTSVTSGHLLLITPRVWERTGYEPVKPEPCSDPGFLAHFFFAGGDESAGEPGGFKDHHLVRSGSGFKLTGKRVFDDSDEGDLFVQGPPVLEASPGIVWARVGEEREGGWRGENFKLAERELAQVLGGRQGRFFVRVYDDREGRLLDSGQFRYLRDLESIRVNGAPYCYETLLLPLPSGHRPTEVEFVGAHGTVIHPVLPAEAEFLDVSGGSLVAQPIPDADDISCGLEAEDGRVDIRLALPRVWWRIVRSGDREDGTWRDTPLASCRSEFQKFAAENAELRLRVPRRVEFVEIAFDHEEGVRRPNRRGEVSLPLVDFIDHQQIDERIFNDALLNVRFGEPGHSRDQDDREMLCLIRVAADPLPGIVSFQCDPGIVESGEQATLRWETRNAGEGVNVAIEPSVGAVPPAGDISVVLSETTTFVLKLTAPDMAEFTSQVTARVRSRPDDVEKPVARVWRACGWRSGKGFSQRELHAAGLPAAVAKRQSIPVDPRRRSEHSPNVKALRRLMGG